MADWQRQALWLIAAVTGLRLVLLAFNRTDLFVDEAQYWFWGQNLDWGYFSKPPLIAWLLRAVSEVLGDSTFAIRAPGAVLHGATAFLLGMVAERRFGAGLAAVVVYLLAPFVGLGSLLMSTDTVMLPLLALAWVFHTRLVQSRGLGDAVAVGLAVGFACMAKYAGIYALVGFLLANVFAEARIGWRASVAMVLACLAVLVPNLIWNLGHGMATVTHTAGNIGGFRAGGFDPLAALAQAGEFAVSQFGVFGPISFAALVWVLARRTGPRDVMLAAALPLVLVTLQALKSQAYANWALAAYIPGTLLAAQVLVRHQRWLWGGAAVNGLLALALPLLTVFPDAMMVQGKPVVVRYLGRADLSAQVLALAQAQGLAVASANRDILADLFYTGRAGNVAVFAVPPKGAPDNYYEQTHALPQDHVGEVLFVGLLPEGCAQAVRLPLEAKGIWAERSISANRIDPACLR